MKLAFLAFLVCAACNDGMLPTIPDPVGPEAPVTPRPPTLTARIDGRTYDATDSLGFNAQLVDVNKGGIRLSAQLRGALRHRDGVVNDTDFRLIVSGTPDGGPLPQRVEFTRYDAFSGSLYWIAPGQAVRTYIGIYHATEGHYDFGPHEIVIERRSHEDPES